MSNQIITNKHASTLDLTPLRDVFDVIVVLRPQGTPGDSREISEETAADEIVERVKRAGWVSVTATGALAAPVAVAPEPVAVAPEPEMSPEPEPEPEPTAKPSRSSRNK